ncbi:MAG: acyl-CoA-binding protein [Spirosomaceae bacterium]|nr:acyl-CoA-binding protein [Spirosomataceae bacterium]
MDLAKEFQEAVSTSKTFSKGSNDDKLTLYKLYKQATDGDVSGSRPGMFDMVGRAKWDAWASVKGISKEDAMKKYVEAVKNLGAKH